MKRLNFSMGGHDYSAVVRLAGGHPSQGLVPSWFVSVDGNPEIRAFEVEPQEEDQHFTLRGKLAAAAHRRPRWAAAARIAYSRR